MDNFWVKFGAVVVAVLCFYFLMSPYQKCLRFMNEMGGDSQYVNAYCLTKTRW